MILLDNVPKLVDELLQPIAGDNPSGRDLRYDPIYDAIKEARREDDDLKQGDWKIERKIADLPKTISLSSDALKTKSKDLQIAAWLTDALLRKEGFPGLVVGLTLLHGLLEKFWDTLYPVIEDDDLEPRAVLLRVLEESNQRNTRLDIRVKEVALNRDGHSFYKYDESRAVGFEADAKDAAQKKKREKDVADGKLTPELFDKSFRDTPKVFYAALEKGIDESLASLVVVSAFCDEKFRDLSPSTGKLKDALDKVRRVVHNLLEEKRKIEPDPVVAAPPPEPDKQEAQPTPGPDRQASTDAPAGRVFSFQVTSSESPARRELVDKVAAVAAVLRQQDPGNPAPYLMMRGLRWGDLRAAAWLSDSAMLEAPPTDVRQLIKRLALGEQWKELLEAAEAVMALPCSRAWLDLQRFVVDACVALGSSYDPIALAIRSELRCLLRDVPQLLDATLMDDTPAANHETQKWLREILKEPAEAGATAAHTSNGDGPRWERKFVDSQALAKEALRTGSPDKAIEIMSEELSRQRSARGRFQRRIQFVELCVAAGKDAIVQPMLDDLIATIDNHKLEEWEDKSVIAAALVTIARASKKIQATPAEKQKVFERVCRLDPVQALNF